jgi:hypothetical protein
MMFIKMLKASAYTSPRRIERGGKHKDNLRKFNLSKSVNYCILIRLLPQNLRKEKYFLQ